MSLSLNDVIGVNRKHSLNRGRICWWLCLPRTMGGRQWFDLMGKNHAATALMDAASGWRPTSRPGGASHMLFDGVDDLVQTAGAVVHNIGTGGFTVAGWVKPSAAVVTNPLPAGGVFGTLNSRNLLCSMDNTGGGFGFNLFSPYTSGTVLTADVWSRVVALRRGSTLFFYCNGVQSPNTYAVASSFGTSSGVLVGHTSADGAMDGCIDDVTLCSRGWSDAEVLQDYNLSRAGYPGVLLREGDNA